MTRCLDESDVFRKLSSEELVGAKKFFRDMICGMRKSPQSEALKQSILLPIARWMNDEGKPAQRSPWVHMTNPQKWQPMKSQEELRGALKFTKEIWRLLDAELIARGCSSPWLDGVAAEDRLGVLEAAGDFCLNALEAKDRLRGTEAELEAELYLQRLGLLRHCEKELLALSPEEGRGALKVLAEILKFTDEETAQGRALAERISPQKLQEFSAALRLFSDELLRPIARFAEGGEEFRKRKQE
jgi:hypothetical protein